MHEHQDAFRIAVQADLGPLAALPDAVEPGHLHRFSTNGKRGDLSGWWSRRITQEHRLVYLVRESRIDFLQARYHY